MSERETFDQETESHSTVYGIDPANPDGGLTVVSERHYRDGVLISETHRDQESIEIRGLSQFITPETRSRLSEIIAGIKERLNSIPFSTAQSEALEQFSRASRNIAAGYMVDRRISAGYCPPAFNTTQGAFNQLRETANRISPEHIPQEAIDQLNSMSAELREGIRQSLDRMTTQAILRSFYLDEEELARQQRHEEMMRLLRDRMFQSSQLPPEVLSDDGQHPPGFGPQSSYPSRMVPPGTPAQRLNRFSLYEGMTPHDYLTSRPWQERSDQPSACKGCKHYDGNVYGGNQLICGMYPYGPEADGCDDREAWAQDEWREALQSSNWRSLDFDDRQLWLDRVEELAVERYRGEMKESMTAQGLLDRINIGVTSAGSVTVMELDSVIIKVRAES